MLRIFRKDIPHLYSEPSTEYTGHQSRCDKQNTSNVVYQAPPAHHHHSSHSSALSQREPRSYSAHAPSANGDRLMSAVSGGVGGQRSAAVRHSKQSPQPALDRISAVNGKIAGKNALEDSGHFGPDSDELSDEVSERQSSQCSSDQLSSSPITNGVHKMPSGNVDLSQYSTRPLKPTTAASTALCTSRKIQALNKRINPQATLSEETVDSGLETNRDSLTSVGTGAQATAAATAVVGSSTFEHVKQQIKNGQIVLKHVEHEQTPPPPLPACPPPVSPLASASCKSGSSGVSSNGIGRARGGRSPSNERQWTYQQKDRAKKVHSEVLNITMRQKPKTEQRGFGFSLKGGKTRQETVTVEAVIVGTAADRAGVQINDEVLAINGQSVADCYLAKVNHLVHESLRLGEIELTVRRYVAGHPSSTTDADKPTTTAHNSNDLCVTGNGGGSVSMLLSPSSSSVQSEFDSKRSLFDQPPDVSYAYRQQQQHKTRSASVPHKKAWQSSAMHNPGSGRPVNRPATVANAQPMPDPILQLPPGKISDFIPEAERSRSRDDYKVSAWTPDRPVGRLTDFVPEAERDDSKAPSDYESRSHVDSTRSSSPTDEYVSKQVAQTLLIRNYDLPVHRGHSAVHSPQSSVTSSDSRTRAAVAEQKDPPAATTGSRHRQHVQQVSSEPQQQPRSREPSAENAGHNSSATILQDKTVALERYHLIKQQANARPAVELTANGMQQPGTPGSNKRDRISPDVPLAVNGSTRHMTGRQLPPPSSSSGATGSYRPTPNYSTATPSNPEQQQQNQHHHHGNHVSIVENGHHHPPHHGPPPYPLASPPAYDSNSASQQQQHHQRGYSYEQQQHSSSRQHKYEYEYAPHDSQTQQQQQQLNQAINGGDDHLTPTEVAAGSGGQEPVLSVSGKQKCSHCHLELGRGAAMIIESLNCFYHLQCFRCVVCAQPLGDGQEGTDVRVRAGRLHCNQCYSNDEAGWKYSEV